MFGELLNPETFNSLVNSKLYLVPFISLVVSIGIIPVTTDFLLISLALICSGQDLFVLKIIPLLLIPILAGEFLLHTMAHKLKSTKRVSVLLDTPKALWIRNIFEKEGITKLILLRCVPAYKSTCFFLSNLLGLKKAEYYKLYPIITILYVLVYFFVPYFIAVQVNLTADQILKSVLGTYIFLFGVGISFKYFSSINKKAQE